MTKRQKIVLTLLGMYIVILIVLTLFSKWFMDASLLEVTVYFADSAYVNGKRYETVVRTECIILDDGASAVFEVKKKDTPLGTRYYVKRCTIEILAEDGYITAILPLMEANTMIVAKPQTDLKDGVQVKLQNDK